MSTRTRVMLGLSIGLALVVSIGPLLVPVPPLTDTVPPRQLADPDSRFIRVQGVELHYKMAGQGEPVFVLLHGFGASLFSWHKVMPELARLGTVIAYDRPAFGLSERPLQWEGQNPYSPEAQVDQLFGLMDALGIERAILVGNSAGGTVALRAALARPDRVQAIIAVDAAVYGTGGAPGFIRPLLRTPQLRHLGPLIVRRLIARGDDLIRRAWHNPDRIDPATWEGYHKPLRAQNWDRALWEFTVAGRADDLAGRLAELTMPVLVVTGDDDRIVPTEQSLRLAQDLPNARLVVLAECGHLPQEECPEDFMRAVQEHLDFLTPVTKEPSTVSIEQLNGHQYLNLETFRKDGRGVKTPVWFVREGDALYVWTQADSGKVKRIRNNPHVRIAPGDARGNPLGEWMDARAEIHTTPEAIHHVQRLMAAKYGMLFHAFRLLGKFRRARYVTLRITLPDEDAA